jgi:von Willebrand factor type A domain
MPRLGGARRGSARKVALAAVAFGAVIAFGLLQNTGTSSSTVTLDNGTAPDNASGKYTATVDEGLGASIALLLDVSGSMRDKTKGEKRAKYLVAREALRTILATTDEFVARQPDFPINVGLYTFSGEVTRVVPVARYNRAELEAALAALGRPDGGTPLATRWTWHAKTCTRPEPFGSTFS